MRSGYAASIALFSSLVDIRIHQTELGRRESEQRREQVSFSRVPAVCLKVNGACAYFTCASLKVNASAETSCRDKYALVIVIFNCGCKLAAASRLEKVVTNYLFK
jgi:hypothetical protein